MYVAPESKIMMVMANVVSTSPVATEGPTDDPDLLPGDDFD